MDHLDKLRLIARSTGLTQEALAQRLGVSFATLNAWINGRSQPRRKALQAIDLLYVELVDGALLDNEALEALEQHAHSLRVASSRLRKDRALLDKLTLLFTYHTDAIEGSTMTLADTEVVLFDNSSLSNRSFVEQLEARNHQATLWWLIDKLQHSGFVIDEQLALDLHTRLMNGILSDAGRYRRHAVRIANSRVTVSNYRRVPELMQELCKEKPPTGPTLVTFMADQHARFERIHPFSDGNGRVGRLLLLAFALSEGMIPPIILRERRALYYKALETAQVGEDLRLLRQLIAESVVTTSENVFDRI